MKTKLDEKIKAFEKTYGDPPVDDSGLAADKSKSRVAYEVVIAPLFFGGIGFLIDNQFTTAPLFSLLLFFVGFATGVYNAWRAMNGQDMRVGLRTPSKPHENPPKNNP